MFSKFQCWRCDKVTSEGKKCGTCGMAYYCSDRCRINDVFRHNSSECRDVAARYVCHGCNKKTAEEMMMCTNCMNVWFCSQQCQRKAWKSHKDECKEISSSVVQLSFEVQSRYQPLRKNPGMPVTYYWGNSPAIDLLNLPTNEGLEYNKSLSLLLCGVGDPRNVCLTISRLQDTKYEGKVTFVMNDICACVLARTVLLLYLLCKGGEDKAESVTQIWYSLYLSEEDHKFVVAGLRDLVQIPTIELITHGIMKINVEQFNSLKNVWKTWLHLSEENIDIFQKRCYALAEDEKENRYGINCYLNKMQARHRPSVKLWYKNGLLLPKKKGQKLTKENFTLMGSSFQFEHNAGSFTYAIPTSCLPYIGWDYKAVRAAFPHTDSLNEMYNTYVTGVLRKCAARLQSDDIQMSFILSNCTDIPPYLPEGMTFDRITMSNLWDFIPLPKLLTLGKPLLNPVNNSAVIVTETMNWSQSFYPNLIESKLGMLDLLPCREMRDKVLKDTGSKSIANSSDLYAFIEYRSFKEEFTCFLRASLLIPTDYANTKLLPSVNQFAAELGLKPRDFTCRENKVEPFRWSLNCRRVTLMRGFERTIEWIISK